MQIIFQFFLPDKKNELNVCNSIPFICKSNLNLIYSILDGNSIFFSYNTANQNNRRKYNIRRMI